MLKNQFFMKTCVKNLASFFFHRRDSLATKYVWKLLQQTIFRHFFVFYPLPFRVHPAFADLVPPSPRDPIQLVGEETLFWGALVSKKVDRRSKSLMRTRLAHVGQPFLVGHNSTLKVALRKIDPRLHCIRMLSAPKSFHPQTTSLKN